MKDLRNAALAYADRGWHILPLEPGGKAPIGSLAPKGKDSATNDLVTILQWWTKVPDANIGLHCEASGLVVVDVDPRNGGDKSFSRLEEMLGALPTTVSAKTGGGGWHYLFELPDTPIVSKGAPGVDIKLNGYIVLPPSRHASGCQYAWSVSPEEARPAALPAKWASRLQAAPRREIKPQTSDDELLQIPAEIYFPALTERDVDQRGMVQCPFHKNGQERTPSLATDGHVWTCYACPSPNNKRALGGNIYDLAALVKGMPVPLSGPDFAVIRAELERLFAQNLTSSDSTL